MKSLLETEISARQTCLVCLYKCVIVFLVFSISCFVSSRQGLLLLIIILFVSSILLILSPQKSRAPTHAILILYIPIVHNSLCLPPPTFCINCCCEMLFEICTTPTGKFMQNWGAGGGEANRLTFESRARADQAGRSLVKRLAASPLEVSKNFG